MRIVRTEAEDERVITFVLLGPVVFLRVSGSPVLKIRGIPLVPGAGFHIIRTRNTREFSFTVVPLGGMLFAQRRCIRFGADEEAVWS
jgi:hypothetical protein